MSDKGYCGPEDELSASFEEVRPTQTLSPVPQSYWALRLQGNLVPPPPKIEYTIERGSGPVPPLRSPRVMGPVALAKGEGGSRWAGTIFGGGLNEGGDGGFRSEGGEERA